MPYNYDEWSDKHKDSIALCIGGLYGIILIIIAIFILIYAK